MQYDEDLLTVLYELLIEEDSTKIYLGEGCEIETSGESLIIQPAQ
jgi:hypothetical protein